MRSSQFLSFLFKTHDRNLITWLTPLWIFVTVVQILPPVCESVPDYSSSHCCLPSSLFSHESNEARNRNNRQNTCVTPWVALHVSQYAMGTRRRCSSLWQLCVFFTVHSFDLFVQLIIFTLNFSRAEKAMEKGEQKRWKKRMNWLWSLLQCCVLENTYFGQKKVKWMNRGTSCLFSLLPLLLPVLLFLYSSSPLCLSMTSVFLSLSLSFKSDPCVCLYVCVSCVNLLSIHVTAGLE